MALDLRAWGPIGHKATALVAEAYLSPAAKAEIANLLDGKRLVDVANWADDMRGNPDYAHTLPYHYQNTRTSDATPEFDYQNNLLSLTAGGRKKYRAGVVEAITASEKILKNPMATRSEKQMALKFLVHFVGDLHQPLHTGSSQQQGGNPIQLNWQGGRSNLHKVWDSEIIYGKLAQIEGSRHRDPSWKYAQWLLDTQSAEVKTKQTTVNVLVWYRESLNYLPFAYDQRYLTDQNQYSKEASTIIDRRVLQGGKRLAEILNLSLSEDKTSIPTDSMIQFVEGLFGALEKWIRLAPRAAK